MRYKEWILIALITAGASFLSLSYLVTRVWPDPQTMFALPQLLFFLFIFLGLSSGVVPVAAYLNSRFANPDWLERDRFRLLRQGIWGGLLGILLLYLQLIRALNLTIIMVLAGVFIFIEAFFLTRG